MPAVERLDPSPHDIVDELESTLKSDYTEAPRTSLSRQGLWVGAMITEGRGFIAAKIVGVFPENPARGLPLVRGRLLLLDAETGERLLEWPAEDPTAWRTAAATALALKHLGFKGGGVLGIIGAGVQARVHAQFLTHLFGFDEVLVASRTWEKARALASLYGGMAVERRELLSKSDVVVAATTSNEPVVEGELLKSGAYVASVGAPRPVRELDDKVKSRARCVVVDSPIAGEESDDARGVESILLSDLVRGGASCGFGDIRVYKSVGTPVLDLAAAIYIYRTLGSHGQREDQH
ncbi:MAG: ornithine cyclodeaminase family protein [Aeropyrum sp.]|nr:ornithine cyclodeaminase family protein [Aeropyrum sp.]